VILSLVLRPVGLNCGRFYSHSTKHQADDFNIRGIGHDTSFFQRVGKLFARNGMNVSICSVLVMFTCRPADSTLADDAVTTVTVSACETAPMESVPTTAFIPTGIPSTLPTGTFPAPEVSIFSSGQFGGSFSAEGPFSAAGGEQPSGSGSLISAISAATGSVDVSVLSGSGAFSIGSGSTLETSLQTAQPTPNRPSSEASGSTAEAGSSESASSSPPQQTAPSSATVVGYAPRNDGMRAAMIALAVGLGTLVAI
jgi:hypothetical protein